MAAEPPNRPRPGFLTVTYAPSLAEFSVPPATFLAAHPQFDVLVTGTLVFHQRVQPEIGADEDRVLLVQRAAADSMPLLWEMPGGACDDADETLLHAAARELWEETGLRATHVVRGVPGGILGQAVRDERARHENDEETLVLVPEPDVWISRRGLRVAKIHFEVEVEKGEDAAEPRVVLDPREHCRFVWATEEECRTYRVTAQKLDGEGSEVIDLAFTTEPQQRTVLEGFRLRRGG